MPCNQATASPTARVNRMLIQGEGGLCGSTRVGYCENHVIGCRGLRPHKNSIQQQIPPLYSAHMAHTHLEASYPYKRLEASRWGWCCCWWWVLLCPEGGHCIMGFLMFPHIRRHVRCSTLLLPDANMSKTLHLYGQERTLLRDRVLLR